MRHLFTVTHNTGHYTGALFIPAVTAESPDRGREVTEEQARAMYDERLAEAMAGPGTRTRIMSDVFGTWLHIEGVTTREEIPWHAPGKYLNDTPLPITRGTWWYMLEVLPPMHWRHHRGAEMFQMSEMMTGNVTSTMVRVGNAYWHLYAEMGEPPERILQRLRDGIRLQAKRGTDAEHPRARRLLCACCGAVTSGRQWWNRDTGYGLCDACIPANSHSGADMTELEFGFGLQGYHFADVFADVVED